MSIDLYSVMHNEELLLPYWLRHYETFVDRIFIWDDDSTDGTHEILAAHPLVRFLPMEQHGDNDRYWISKLFPQYEIYSRGIADWVMIADADEFLFHRHMKAYLEAEKRKGTTLLLCRGFAMVADAPPSGDGQIYDEIKRGLPDRLESKWTIHSPDIFLRYRTGRHGRPIRKYTGGANRQGEVILLHYRYLGKDYFMERDRRNRERLGVAFGGDFPYYPHQSRNLPDHTRGSGVVWYAEHYKEAYEVV